VVRRDPARARSGSGAGAAGSPRRPVRRRAGGQPGGAGQPSWVAPAIESWSARYQPGSPAAAGKRPGARAWLLVGGAVVVVLIAGLAAWLLLAR
jgi:hypothetical protein